MSTKRMTLREARKQVVWATKELQRLGMGPGTSGNVSVRCWHKDVEGIAIKPSGKAAHLLKPEVVPFVRLDGTYDKKGLKPSSELLFHLAIMRARPDVGAIVHCHSIYATALACALPRLCNIADDLHYHSHLWGGEVECTPEFDLPGSPELARSIVETLGKTKRACLIANHGQLVVGRNIEEGLSLAEMLEQLAHIRWMFILAKTPHRAIPPEMQPKLKKMMATYSGKKPKKK